jgi:uncharacterized protein
MAAGFCWKWSDPTPTVPWSTTSSSTTGGVPGTCARTGHWEVSRPRRCGPPSRPGFGQVGCIDTAQGFEDDFAGVIINVYKVLLTRGLIGCVLYSTDPETRAFLTKLGIPAA